MRYAPSKLGFLLVTQLRNPLPQVTTGLNDSLLMNRVLHEEIRWQKAMFFTLLPQPLALHAWMKSAAMFWAALWKDPGNNELRVTSSSNSQWSTEALRDNNHVQDLESVSSPSKALARLQAQPTPQLQPVRNPESEDPVGYAQIPDP